MSSAPAVKGNGSEAAIIYLKKSSMKKNILLAGVVLLMLSLTGYTQSVTPDVLARFPAAVVVRLYDITAYIQLSRDKQMALAAYFQQEDSLLMNMIAGGRPLPEIRRLQVEGETTEIRKILSGTEYENYCNAKYMDHARKEGLLMARLARQKYDCDSIMSNRLRDLYFSRNLVSEKLYASGATGAAGQDPGMTNGNLYAEVRRFDALIDKYDLVAAGGAYLKNRMDLLESIKPLEQKQRTALQENFSKRCRQSPDKGYVDNFNEAMHIAITDTVYYASIYKDEIGKQSMSNAMDAMKDLERKNKLTKEGAKSIFPIVAEKERRLAVLHAAFPSYTTTRDSLTREVNYLYDSLIRIAMLRDGVSPMASQFTIAVKERKSLGLAAWQVDSLLSLAARLEKMKDAFREKDPLGKFDSKPFETDNMLKVISEDQYRTVLIVKCRGQAKADAEQDWLELQQRHLAANLDKDSTLRQLNDYYLAKWVMYNRYGNDRIKQAANVKDVYEHMPHVLRTLTSARKYNNPTTTVLGEYQTGKQ